MEYERERLLVPKSVACARGKLDKRTYDAEIVVGKDHYVVATGLPSSDAAKQEAEKLVVELFTILKLTAEKFVRDKKLRRARA